VRTSGFHWGNPFYSNGPRSVEVAGVGKGLFRGTSRQKISLRARNLNGDKLKVMVSNLKVVLWGEAEVHPVINTGTVNT
jgi:hypothetical protein